jgi:solute:Na+ symporter, SSS family
MSRGMAVGVVISAPAVILSATLGSGTCPLAVALIGVPAVTYTMFGGVQAVQWTDVKQMVLIVGGSARSWSLLVGIPGRWGSAARCAWPAPPAAWTRSTSASA